ncbi:MAG: hypothetical protein ABJF11_09455 [Reichenbachiella sp.]|uniref:hypothetical protein n=1 Tax=Reichenbachiella sp. TaxID=2184521 RepID=UPI003267D2E7
MRYSWMIVLLVTMACHEQNKNKVSPAELVKSREIKRVTEGEILQGGTILGEEIMQVLDSIIQNKASGDKMDCEFSKWVEIDSLESSYQTDIRYVNSSSTEKVELEFQLLDAYQYSLENDLAPRASVQKLDAKTVLYAYPIDESSTIYTHCLDSTGRTQAQIWSLKMPIKLIINRL